MSNSSEIRVSMIEEVTPGTTPGSPVMKILPTTGQDLQPLVRYIESQTINPDRNRADLVRVGRSSGGTLPCEMRWGIPGEAMYEALRAAMCRQTEDAEITTAACSTGTASNLILKVGATFITDGYQVGDVIRLTGGTAADMGYRVITTMVSETVIEVGGAAFAGSLSDVTLKRGARLNNGSYHRHFTIEISRLDIGKHMVLRKQVFNNADLVIATGAITQASFQLTGGDVENVSHATTGITGATYSTPPTRNVMDAIAVPLLLFGGAEYECNEVRMSLANNAQAREKIGLDSVGTIRRGQFHVNGSMSWYYDGFTEQDKFINNIATSAVVVQEDSTGAAWTYHIPRLKYNNVRASTSGPNTDDTFQGDYSAIVDTTGAYTMRLQRFTA